MKVMSNAARKRFKHQWEKTAKQLRSAGMPAKAVAEMRSFDCDQFINDMKFLFYERSAGTCSGEDGEINELLNTVHDRDAFNSRITVSMQESAGDRGIRWDDAEYDCINDIADKLTDDDRMMLSLVYHNGFSMAETARIMGRDHKSVMRRIRKIRKKIEKNVRRAAEERTAGYAETDAAEAAEDMQDET